MELALIYVANACRYEIMSCCWKLAPEKRPTFSHLVAELDKELQQCHDDDD